MVHTLQRQESVGVPGLLTSHQGGRPAGCSEVSGNPSWWAEPSAFTPQAAENCSQVSSEEGPGGDQVLRHLLRGRT